jgi:putative phosphoesterase
MNDGTINVGLISDTHGLLRPEALAALAESDVIVHGGDIGDTSILARLSTVAHVTAVRGNNDHGAWADALQDTEQFEVGGVRLLVIHDRNALTVDPAAAGVAVVVSGHSHRPGAERRDGVLYVNPGSAGPRRFRLPISVARLTIADPRIDVEFVTLDVAPANVASRAHQIQDHR